MAGKRLRAYPQRRLPATEPAASFNHPERSVPDAFAR